MQHIDIKGLDIVDVRILKQIFIVSDRNNNEVEIGSILYKRIGNPNYNFIKQQEEDRNSLNPIDKFLHEYPKQKNYPVDEIDTIILDAVTKVYPKSFVRSDTIMFNVDLEKLRILKNRNKVNSTMYFSPELYSIGMFGEYAGKTFSAPKIEMNIYTSYNPQLLMGRAFYANYNVENTDLLQTLSTVEFE